MNGRWLLFRDVGMSKYLLPVILFFILASFLFVGLYRDPTEVSSPLIGKPVPQFSLPRLDNGEALFSESEFLGKVSLFNVWASWCVACREEHPVLSELVHRHSVIIYGLNYKDNMADARQYLVEHGNIYLANAVDDSGRVGDRVGSVRGARNVRGRQEGYHPLQAYRRRHSAGCRGEVVTVDRAVAERGPVRCEKPPAWLYS